MNKDDQFLIFSLSCSNLLSDKYTVLLFFFNHP